MALSKTLDINISYNSFNKNINILNKLDSNITSVITKKVTINNAYIKIINQNGDKNNVTLNIGIYDKKDGTLLEQDYYEFIPDVSDGSNNFIKQGYEQLKVNKYIGAIDVLEDDQTV